MIAGVNLQQKSPFPGKSRKLYKEWICKNPGIFSGKWNSGRISGILRIHPIYVFENFPGMHPSYKFCDFQSYKAISAEMKVFKFLGIKPI